MNKPIPKGACLSRNARSPLNNNHNSKIIQNVSKVHIRRFFHLFFFFFFTSMSQIQDSLVCLIYTKSAKRLIEPPHDKTNKMTMRASSEDSDQPDLKLRWAHNHFVGFVKGRLIFFLMCSLLINIPHVCGWRQFLDTGFCKHWKILMFTSIF